jgi:hypothetical protein
MRRVLFGLVGSAVLVTSPSAAQAPDPFEAKVRALAHPRYAEREKAARDLEAAGEPALKALRAAQTSNDEELRARAAIVAEKIDRAARSKRLLVAPTLALKLDRVPLQQAVTEVSQKTGLRFVLERAKDTDLRRPVSVDTGDVPFWQAVREFCEAAGLTEADGPPPATQGPQPTASGRRLVYTSRLSGLVPAGQIRLVEGKSDAPAATGQALRVRALPAGHAQNKYDAATGEVTFHLAVDAAPTLSLQEVIGVEVRRAVADDRRAMAPVYSAPTPGGLLAMDELLVARQLILVDGEMHIAGDSGQAFPVTLKAGATRPKRLAELEGVVVARVLAPPEPLLTVTDVFGKGKGQTVQADGLTCRVTAVEEVAAHPGPPPRVRSGPTERPADRRAEAGPAPASVRVRVVSTTDALTEVMNFPVQLKGRVRPFIRINRRSGDLAANSPELQLRDTDGKVLRVLATGLIESTFDGTTMTQEVHLTFQKPAKGVEGISLTLTGRRPAVVEMPFVLRDVPIP